MERDFRFRRKKNIKRALLLTGLILLAVLLFSVYKLAGTLHAYRNSAQTYGEIAALAVETVTPAPSSSSDMDSMPKTSEIPIRVDWDALSKINGDAAAWLYCEGTPVNYPVVQAGDNSYYLTHGFDRRENAAGALFLDCRNEGFETDKNLIVYGHRMKDHSMFGSIVQYKEKPYYEAHPVLYLLTEKQNYRVEIFSCRTVPCEEKYFETAFQSSAAYESYLIKAAQQSYWQTESGVRTDIATLTLVTCSANPGGENTRLLLHGRLAPVA